MTDSPTILDRAKKSKILGGLSKATVIELFFDLVFIICMRSITPVLTSGEGDVINAYQYYIFVFCFVLMMQTWFSATMLMNRCGTGGKRDVRFLLITMFLLFLLTRVTSMNWEHYLEFNILWCLINVNIIVNWVYRYRCMDSETATVNKRYIRRIVISHGVQIVLVLFSLVLPNVPAQVCCGIALVAGFASWPARHPLTEQGREHLVERCSLFVILAFGETLVGLSSMASDVFSYSDSFAMTIFNTAVYFLLIAGLFLIYMAQVEQKLDVSKIGGGMCYMAITGLQVFCVMNCTAALELTIEGKSLWFMSGDVYFSFFAAVYMLSFYLFLRFNKPPVRTGLGWLVVRFVFCMLPLIIMASLQQYVATVDISSNLVASVISLALAFLSIIFFMLNSYIVWSIDCAMYRPKKAKGKRANKSSTSDGESADESSDKIA